MGFVDLHVHSNASDGTCSPDEVVRLAGDAGLDAIALTDHDTIDGIQAALTAAGTLPVEVVPGVELSCVYQTTEIHILGLFIDLEKPGLSSALDQLKQIRTERNLEMIRRFQDGGIPIRLDDLQGSNPNTVITRAHFAKVLVEKGYAATMDQAFRRYLQYDGPYCIRKEKISPEHAMKLLRENGAVPILAHPCLYKLGYNELDRLISYLKELGLEGLEVYHSSNHQKESQKLQELAKKWSLLPSGGSDFHGSNKPDIQIGTGRGGLRVSHLLLEDIRSQWQSKRPD